MLIDPNAIITATEANQHFSRVAKLAEKKGRVVVFKNNLPKGRFYIGSDIYNGFQMNEQG